MSTETPYWDKPCANRDLVSYRYKGRYGYITIGAENNAHALKEAQRSTTDLCIFERLEKWNGKEYRPVAEDYQ